jgi:Fur family ferric uptake transcriptional regulator
MQLSCNILGAMSKHQIIKRLRKSGAKLTRVRLALVEIFVNSDKPMTAFCLKKLLRERGLAPNKTTIYRELSFLVSEDIVCEVRIKPNVVHYESCFLDHHHHLVCEVCGEVCDLKCKELESAMKLLEKRVLRQGLEIKKHSLEFFGLCANCR